MKFYYSSQVAWVLWQGSDETVNDSNVFVAQLVGTCFQQPGHVGISDGTTIHAFFSSNKI